MIEVDMPDLNAALAAAAAAAGVAPSIHNTQPWHWRVHDGVAELYAEPARHLIATDPDRRMLLVSCGAALDHACVGLAAEGLAVEVVRFPNPADRDHLATISVTDRVPVTERAIRLAQAMAVRYTDRRPLADEHVASAVLDRLRATAAAYGVGLEILDRDQVIELAAATSRSQSDEVSDDDVSGELRAWTGGGHPSATGVPDSLIPQRPLETTVPGRDFGHVGTLPVSGSHDAAASYAILHGADDDPLAWLRAGEALSAMWLVATEWSVAVLPLSAAVEVPSTRYALERILSDVTHPYLAVRLGIADPLQVPTDRTPRLPSTETVEAAP